jgi:hypothetical protein
MVERPVASELTSRPRIDGIEHRGVNHSHHPLRHVWRVACKAGHQWRDDSNGLLIPVGDDVGASFTLAATTLAATASPIEPRYRPYLVQLPAERSTSQEAAAATAAAAVLATVDAKTAGEMKVALAAYLDSIPDGPAKLDASSSRTPMSEFQDKSRLRSWRRGLNGLIVHNARMFSLHQSLMSKTTGLICATSHEHACAQHTRGVA